MPPQLQLALDGDLASSLVLLAQVYPYVDIVEVGTPLLYREGVHALRHIHAHYPDATLLAEGPRPPEAGGPARERVG